MAIDFTKPIGYAIGDIIAYRRGLNNGVEIHKETLLEAIYQAKAKDIDLFSFLERVLKK